MMFGYLRALISQAYNRATLAFSSPVNGHISTPATTELELVNEDKVVVAIGDIHGRHDLLTPLLDKIFDLKNEDNRDMYIVFLGDYIDRGMESDKVIRRLFKVGSEHKNTVFLRGNHEAALLKFLKDADTLSNWLNYGGRETLASYKVKVRGGLIEPDYAKQIQQEFLEKLPKRHLKLIQKTKLSHTIDGCFFAHAGINPDKPITFQSERDLLWIRDPFLKDKRKLPLIIVHGHTPEQDPIWDGRRIGVDTGAYLSNILTAAIITTDSVHFLHN